MLKIELYGCDNDCRLVTMIAACAVGFSSSSSKLGAQLTACSEDGLTMSRTLAQTFFTYRMESEQTIALLSFCVRGWLTDPRCVDCFGPPLRTE